MKNLLRFVINNCIISKTKMYSIYLSSLIIYSTFTLLYFTVTKQKQI